MERLSSLAMTIHFSASARARAPGEVNRLPWNLGVSENLDTYFEHDKSFYRARELVRSNGDSIDLREFSEACRGGFAALRTIVR